MENNEILETVIEDRKALISDIHSNEHKMDELENKISQAKAAYNTAMAEYNELKSK